MNQKKIAMNIDTKADYIVIAFTGDLEYGMIEEIKSELQTLSLDTKHGYIIDMQKVTNIDSTGFGMIVNFAKKVSVKIRKSPLLSSMISFATYSLFHRLIKYSLLPKAKNKQGRLLKKIG